MLIRAQIRCHACIGGTSVREDIDKLRNGQQLVVGTPGRVNDMAGKGHLRLDDCLIFVLDEANGFILAFAPTGVFGKR